MHMVVLMTRLMLVSLDDTAVFPGVPVTLSLDVGADKRVFLVPRRGNEYAKVGVVAEVSERIQLPGRGVAVSLMGLHRGVPGAAQTDRDGILRVDVDERPDPLPSPSLTRELEREYRAVVEEILELRGDDGRLSAFVRSITHPGALADTAGYSPDLNVAQKIELLETLDVVDRLKLALRLQQERLTELNVRKRIRNEVESGAQKQQRDYFLRRQMEAIRKELGETDGSVIDEYQKKIAAAQMPEQVQRQAERELGRLERMGDSNAEASGQSTVGRHSDIDRTAGNRQDLNRRIDRSSHRPKVRPDVFGWCSRRSRDPWSSPHVYRSLARPYRARSARCRHHESSDHARRSR